MDNLFNGNPAEAPQPAAPAAQPSQPNPYADQLAQIKAEDGRQKYADVKTALDSIPHAQKHIMELSEQLRNAQAELEKRKGMEEMLAAMQQTTTQPVQPAGQVLDVNQIASLVNTTLDARTRAEAERSNGNRVRDQLISLYGDKAPEMFNQRAKELGVDPEYLTMQAKTYPDFVLAQFNTKTSPSPQPTKSTINTSGMSPAPIEIKPVIRSATTKSAVEQYRAIAQNLNKTN